MADEQRLSPEQKAQWIAALRSGDFTQGHGCLGSKHEGLCCLGVLCEISGFNYEFEQTGCASGPRELLAMLSREVRKSLSNMNDAGKSFSEIADHIEKNL